jgi:hypothetical protein
MRLFNMFLCNTKHIPKQASIFNEFSGNWKDESLADRNVKGGMEPTERNNKRRAGKKKERK